MFEFTASPEIRAALIEARKQRITAIWSLFRRT